MTRIAIIGGGITGLAAAYRLQKTVSGADIVLFEAAERVGGKIVTDRPDGFVIEGGPDSFLASKPRGLELRSELGIAHRLQGTRDETRRAYVVRGGALHRMPEGLTGLVPSRLEPLLDRPLHLRRQSARLQRELEIPPRPPDG